MTCRLPKTLEILDLSQNSFGDDGLEEFSRHLPPRCAAGEMTVGFWVFGGFFSQRFACFLLRMGGFFKGEFSKVVLVEKLLKI